MKYISKTYKSFTADQFNNPIAQAMAQRYIDILHEHKENGTITHLAGKVNPYRGVTIIIGGTNSGKSRFVGDFAEIMSKDDDQLVANYSFLEPAIEKYAYQLSHPSMLTEKQFVTEFTEALNNGVTSFFIDSFRVIQYDIKGASASGGMSTGVFGFLTQLSELCYQMNIAMFVPINPNVKDDLYDYTFKNLKGATHNIIDIESNQFSFRDLDRLHEQFTNVNMIHDLVTNSSSEEVFSFNELAVTTFKATQQPNLAVTADLIEAIPANKVETSFAPNDDANTTVRIKHLNNI